MNMMSLYGSLGNPTKNFQILTLSCHSQTVVMARWNSSLRHLNGNDTTTLPWTLYFYQQLLTYVYIYFFSMFLRLLFWVRFPPYDSVWWDPTIRDFCPCCTTSTPSSSSSRDSDAIEVDTSTSSLFRVFGSSDGSPDGSESTDLMENGFFSAVFV